MLEPNIENQFKIREMTLEDLKVVLGWAIKEGWAFAEKDAEPMLNADPKGFFVGEVNG
jgi:hypothetical protein